MTVRTIRRFYDSVAIGRRDDGFRILLGGRAARTAAGQEMVLSTAALAGAVANEWLAQGDHIRLETMPLTRLAATSAERVPARREAVVDALIGYAGTDLLCYRAEGPGDLVALEQRSWQPIVDWAAERFGARLRVSDGILPVEQPAAAIAALRAAVESTSDAELTALSCAVEASGSLLIGLALLCGRLDADQAFAACMLDEHYQAERWGSDAEAERRRSTIVADLRDAMTFLALTRPPSQAAAAGAAIPANGSSGREPVAAAREEF